MKKLAKSFVHAFTGIGTALYEEQSFRVQLAIAMIVVILMIVFPLTSGERGLLVALIGLVLSLELVNSIVERVLDIIEQEHHPKIRDAKDIMAAAVLVSSLAALVAGIVIFAPYIRVLLT